MRRWGWIFALLVSVGLNAGILATLWVTRAKNPPPRPHETEGQPPRVRVGEPPPFAVAPNGPPVDPRQEPQGTRPSGPPPGGAQDDPRPRREDEPGRPGPVGRPLDDGPFGGETAEVGPEPGTVGPVPKIAPPKMREFAERLGLSGEKRERFFALQLGMMAAMRDGRWQIARLRREVRVEMLSERPDRTKIEANLAAIQNAQLLLERQTVRTVLATREILDGEPERQYLEFITRMRMGAGEPRRPAGGPLRNPRMEGRPEMPGAQDREVPSEDPRMNRPVGPRGGGFGRPRLGPRGERMLSPQERLERRRRFEEWRARQGAGQTTPPPQRSDPEGETPPPGG